MGRTREDRIALRQARFMGATLSTDDADDADLGKIEGLSSHASGEPKEQKPIVDANGKVSMPRLLSALLKALGVDVPETSDSDFNAALMQAAMDTVLKLARGGAGNNDQATGQNPLIPGGPETQPIYMSVTAPPPPLTPERIEQIASEMARRMGGEPQHGGCAFGLTREENALVEALVSKMGDAVDRR